MLKGRLNIPDFGPFPSPLPSGSWSDVPGCAIAERIFNDPDSWDDTSDYPEDIENDTVAWLTEEIEKIRIHSAGVGGNGNVELNTSDKKVTTRDSLIPNVEAKYGWKSIGRRSTLRPISLAGFFEHPNNDFSKEVQQHLSKILNSGGIRHHIGPPLSATGPTTPNTADSSSTASTSSVDDVPSPPCPPSATLSFLELYGIYPESPRDDGRNYVLPRMKTIRKAAKDKEAASRNASLNVSVATPTSQPTSTKRGSSIPPLNLPIPPQVSPTYDLRLRGNPPGLPKPPNYESPQLQNNSQEQGGPLSHPPDLSPRSRPLPKAAPPPYELTTRTSTPNYTSDPASTTPLRRLPSVPQKQTNSFPPSNKITRTGGTPPRQVPAVFPPPAQTSTAWPFALTPHTSSPQTPHSLFSARSPPSFRSPVSVPLGPRTRARSADAGRPITTV